MLPHATAAERDERAERDRKRGRSPAAGGRERPSATASRSATIAPVAAEPAISAQRRRAPRSAAGTAPGTSSALGLGAQ